MPPTDDAPAWRRFLAARRRFEVTEAVVAGARLRARRSREPPAASDPVVVLVAGLGLSGRYLLPLGAELAPHLPVWVPHLPGFGGSEAPRRALDVPELGDALVAWMDGVGLPSAALVANSMGCQVAIEAAARHPGRVSHLVLEGPTMDAHARSVARHVVRIAIDAGREPPSLVPLQVAEWLATGPRRLLGTVRHAFAHAPEARLASVTCPTLVVRGGRDPIVPQRWAEEVAGGLPHGALHVVPGGSHAMTYSAPGALASITVAFLLTGTPPTGG